MKHAIELHHEVAQFLYREARYQDQHAYDDWEALWTDDGVYWVPANGGDTDPEKEMSFIYDNRSRIALRIRQLHTGKRHTQTPPSQLARVVSNIEILSEDENEIIVAANVMVFETNLRKDTMWATSNEYTLRRDGDDFRMSRKKVVLVNSDRAIFTLSFLI